MVAKITFVVLTILAVYSQEISLASVNRRGFGIMVYNGQNAVENQFPWQVLVQSNFTDGAKYCGGVILSETWILTSANCVGGADNVTLSLGSNLWTTPQLFTEALNVITHPNYKNSKHNDLGLVELDEPLKFSDSIQKVHLPTKDQIGITFVGVKSRFSGWGLDPEDKQHPGLSLKYVDMKVIKNSECASDYGSIVTDSVVCTTGGRICGSDFGGPLTVEEKEGWVLIGIASFNLGCESEKPIGFSRVTSYLNWISNVTGIEITL